MIDDYLKKIKEAQYGEEVRESIHDAISQCYQDATGNPESIAACVEQIATLDSSVSGLDTSVDTLMTDLTSVTGRVKTLEDGSAQYAGLVYHGYDNSAVTCSTTSGSYTGVPAFTSKEDGIYSSFATFNVNAPSAATGGALLQIEKNGFYLFDIRVQFNSGTANKRVEFCPFIDSTRDGAHSYSFCTPGDFYLTHNVQIPLRLTEGQTVYFAIAPVENVAVSARIVDINVWALDWEGR